MLLIALGACTSMPSVIPDSPGTATAEDAPLLLSIASPDLPTIPWLTAGELAAEDYRDCPKVYNSPSFVANGYDCVDSSGIQWSGTMSASVTGTATWFTLNQFGPTGVEGGWVASGTIGVTETSGGYTVDTTLELDSWDGDEQVWWIDTEMGLGESSSTYYAEHYTGTIGLQDWGTATVEGKNVLLGTVNGCTYANHGGGTLALAAANAVDYGFSDSVLGPPAPPTSDTGSGGGDTGGPLDTGDTGDTGNSGSGGGSGSDDTGTTTPDIGSGDACGICTSVSIDGDVETDCISPDRTVAYAFPSLF